jgi:hypothetical protein
MVLNEQHITHLDVKGRHGLEVVRQRGSTKLEHEKKMGLDPNMFEE